MGICIDGTFARSISSVLPPNDRICVGMDRKSLLCLLSALLRRFLLYCIFACGCCGFISCLDFFLLLLSFVPHLWFLMFPRLLSPFLVAFVSLFSCSFIHEALRFLHISIFVRASVALLPDIAGNIVFVWDVCFLRAHVSVVFCISFYIFAQLPHLPCIFCMFQADFPGRHILPFWILRIFALSLFRQSLF